MWRCWSAPIIGSGNVGRNTTLIRSNYVIDGNTQFFEHSLKLWEGLSHELNFNCMVSHRGQIVLATNPVQLDTYARRGNIMRLNGIDAELLDRGQVMALLPYLDYSRDARWPIWGGIIQGRAGSVRHDAVAWGLCPRRRYAGRGHHRELRSRRLHHG
nr:FAD dependent oxidoreductase [uncultured bacterium]